MEFAQFRAVSALAQWKVLELGKKKEFVRRRWQCRRTGTWQRAWEAQIRNLGSRGKIWASLRHGYQHVQLKRVQGPWIAGICEGRKSQMPRVRGVPDWEDGVPDWEDGGSRAV
jgi:hypothetical protein